MSKFVVGLFAVIMFTAAGANLASAGPGDPLEVVSEAPTRVPRASTCPSVPAARAANFPVSPPNPRWPFVHALHDKRTTVMPLKCTMACAINFATAISKGLTYDYDYCEKNWPQFSCENRWSVALQKLDQGTCMNCLDDPARQALYPTYSAVTATVRDQVFCDNNPNNTPFPDGHGFVSQQRDVVNCQAKVIRNLMKAAKCLNLHCHAKLADLKYWDKPIRTTNAQCEDADATKSCKAHFDLAHSKLSGCPPCVDKDAIWTSFQGSLDLHNGDIYCSDAP